METLINVKNSPVQLTPSPLYPWLQVQMKLPGVLVHSALALQLLPPVLHSSISNITDDNKHYNNIIMNLTKNSPVQLTPSPLYPWLQVHVKLPAVLVHSALASQLLPPVLHSSTSS